MSDLITLEVVDADGAVQEHADALGGTRMDFFKKAGVAGGSLLAGGVLMGGLPAIASASPRKSRKNDVAILNFALTLEYLEAAFYNEAIAKKALSGDVLATAVIVQTHENTHVRTLRAALGGAAVKKPKFDFKDTTSDPAKFLATAVALEDTGVSAYQGQAANIFQPAVLRVAASILPVEARHASRFRALNGEKFAPHAFDHAASKAAVLKAVKKTGFIKG